MFYVHSVPRAGVASVSCSATTNGESCASPTPLLSQGTAVTSPIRDQAGPERLSRSNLLCNLSSLWRPSRIAVRGPIFTRPPFSDNGGKVDSPFSFSRVLSIRARPVRRARSFTLEMQRYELLRYFDLRVRSIDRKKRNRNFSSWNDRNDRSLGRASTGIRQNSIPY